MSLSDENITDIIERYIQGRMSEKEQIAFETQLTTDAELNKQLEIQKVMQAIMVEEGLKDIRQIMQRDIANTKNNNLGKWLGISIAIVLLTGSSVYYINSISTPEQNNTGNTTSPNPIINKSATIATEKNISPLHKNEYKTNVQEPEKQPILSRDTVYPSKEIISPNTNTSVTNITPINLPEKTVTTSTKTVVKKEILNCKYFKPEYTLTVQPTIVGQRSGKITIISRDKSLKYSLNENESESLTYFDELKKGIYSIKISNTEGCELIESGIQVASTYCMNLDGEKFNASLEETYKFPFIIEDLVEIQIYDKKNQLVKTITQSDTPEWDGRNKEGILAETGLYRIIGIYPNGEKCYYSLTVFN